MTNDGKAADLYDLLANSGKDTIDPMPSGVRLNVKQTAKSTLPSLRKCCYILAATTTSEGLQRQAVQKLPLNDQILMFIMQHLDCLSRLSQSKAAQC